MAGSDPVKDGLVERLNRPGANVTGVVFFGSYLGGSVSGGCRTLLPANRTLGMLVNPNNLNTESERRDVQAAARAVGQS